MRKILAIIISVSFLFTMFACESEKKQENITTTATDCKETTAFETESETTEITAYQAASDVIWVGDFTDAIEEGTFIINKGKYKIEFIKKDYENHYSKEVLNEIYEAIPTEFGLSFGCDDYDNWNGAPNDILNDTYHSMGCWKMESYDYGTSEHKKAVQELNNSPYGNPNLEGFFTSVEKINSFLRGVYGPEARVFKANDFDTYNEIMQTESSVFYDYDYSFRFAYLPESEVVCCFARETWGGETQAKCVCDVRMSNGDYIVEVVSDTYYSYCAKYIMTMSSEPNGNIYVKSIEDFYVFPTEIESNARVISEKTEVKAKKYESGDWVVVDVFSVGAEVYKSGWVDFEEKYVWIVTDEYEGRVDRKYLTTIE